jgi:probable HAF family extracellular repeat protein
MRSLKPLLAGFLALVSVTCREVLSTPQTPPGKPADPAERITLVSRPPLDTVLSVRRYTVRVVDAKGFGVAQVVLNAFGGSQDAVIREVTDSAGFATVQREFGPTAGLQSLTLIARGLDLIPLAILDTALPGQATAVTMDSLRTRSVVAGDSLPPMRVVVIDKYGNTKTNFADDVSVELMANPSGDTLQGIVTLPAVNGEATFSGVSLRRARAGYMLRARAWSMVSAPSAAIEVLPALAESLVFSTQPADGIVGWPAERPVRVEGVDRFGNRAAGLTDTIVLSLAEAPAGATLRGTTRLAAALGVAAFLPSFDVVGAGYRLEARAPLGAVRSNTFQVTRGDGQYHAIDLGTLGGNIAMPAALNDAGIVVGRSKLPDGTWRGFFWDGAIHDLGAPGGTSSSAGAISPRGVIAGAIDGHPATWENGAARIVGPAFPYASAVAVNDRQDILLTVITHEWSEARVYHDGQVQPFTIGASFAAAADLDSRGNAVGGAWVGPEHGGTYHPALWRDGAAQDLGTLATLSCDFGDGPVPCQSGTAYDINERGDIVGTYDDSNRNHRPFLWQNGVMRELPIAPGASASALHINERGQVVGVIGSGYLAQGGVGYLYENGVMTDLGSLGGGGTMVTALGEDGSVVGSSLTASGERHAFLWQDGVMRDLGLGPMGGAKSVAIAINANGDILGWSNPVESPAREWYYAQQPRAIVWRIAR